MENCFAVIMAGGRGQRFWPLSTSKRPKQVLSITGDKPMIALAVERLEGLIPPDRTLVIAGREHVDAICEAAPALPRKNVIGEPCGRDTAAVCALASALVKARAPKGAFCILTADHIIKDLDVFRETLRQGLQTALSRNVLMTIGIQPTFPSTAYGYIESGEQEQAAGAIAFFKVKRFVEKPDRGTAERYVGAGNFLWNSGMFVWSVESIQQALGKHRPELLAMAERILPTVEKRSFGACLAEEYEKIERISVDYAIMEKANNILMAKGLFRWYDVGSWSALGDLVAPDGSGNSVVGKAEFRDASGNIVVSPEKPTMLLGVKGLIVVQAPGATLVCARDRAEEVKKLVDQLAQRGGYDNIL